LNRRDATDDLDSPRLRRELPVLGRQVHPQLLLTFVGFPLDGDDRRGAISDEALDQSPVVRVQIGGSQRRLAPDQEPDEDR
jgi:hypothetical protein